MYIFATLLLLLFPPIIITAPPPIPATKAPFSATVSVKAFILSTQINILHQGSFNIPTVRLTPSLLYLHSLIAVLQNNLFKMCYNHPVVAPTAEAATPTVPGNINFLTPNAFYCCQCGQGPWACSLYAACIECGHHFGADHCKPAYCNGEFSYSSSTFPLSQLSGQRLTSSTPKASGSSSISFYGVSGVSPNSSTTDLTSPNVRLPPPVSHSSLAIHGPSNHAGAHVGEPTPSAAPPVDGGEATFYCCQCGNGPFIVNLYPACITCHHAPCRSCKLEYH